MRQIRERAECFVPADCFQPVRHLGAVLLRARLQPVVIDEHPRRKRPADM